MPKQQPIIVRFRAPEPPADIYVGTVGIEILLGSTRFYVEGEGDGLRITLAEGITAQMTVEPRYANLVIIRPGRTR